MSEKLHLQTLKHSLVSSPLRITQVSTAFTMQPSKYPDPYTIFPESPNIHTNTLILLHGTSTSGPELATPLISSSFQTLSSNGPTTLPLCFPTCKLIFPTGPLNPTTVFNGRASHAWFDVHSFADRTLGEDSMTFRRGLKASIRYLGSLIKAECDILEKSGDNQGQVVLLGFSQGAAMAAILLLSGELDKVGIGSNFGGVAGMSGWLPLRSKLDDIINNNFQRNSSGAEKLKDKRERATAFLRRYLDLDEYTDGSNKAKLQGDDNESLRISIFLGHGKIDEKVKPEWGRQMRDLLTDLGLTVESIEYDDLAHWWNKEELADLAAFLEKTLVK